MFLPLIQRPKPPKQWNCASPAPPACHTIPSYSPPSRLPVFGWFTVAFKIINRRQFKAVVYFILYIFVSLFAAPNDGTVSPLALPRPPWLIKSGFVSVGYTPQTTDICVCFRHVDNIGPTCRKHSLKSAFFSPTKPCRGIVSPTHIPTCL